MGGPSARTRNCSHEKKESPFHTVFISVINQLDEQNFCCTERLFHTSTTSEWSKITKVILDHSLVSV